MLVPTSNLALTQRIGVVQTFPEGCQSFLDNGEELRLMVVSSLGIQCILILFGAKRQFWTNIFLRSILWSAYLSADWFATTSLAVLSNKRQQQNTSDCAKPLVALWGPLLLLHLGGQDTITAYSMEDNALWSPNYARYMETYNSASYEGYGVDVKSLIQSPSIGDATAAVDHYTYGPAVTVRTANRLLKISKLLFADLILSFQDVSESRSSLLSGDGKRGFEVMEIELGFMYDVFYTKAPIVYSFIDVLLLGAIVSDIYSVISMLFSDWTMLWLTMHKNKVTCKAISLIQYVKCKKRWSCNIGQFNLISFCLPRAKKERCSESGMCGFNCGKTFKTKAAKSGLATMITGAWLSYQKYKHTNTNTVSVTDDLKEIIFEHFVNKIKEGKKRGEDDSEENNTIFYYNWGNKVLEGSKLMLQEINLETIRWSVEVEFDQSILLWHIATNICYNSVANEVLENGRSYRETSKWLSEYMLYLLVMRPSMLPNGIGEIRFQDTCAEATEFIRDRHYIENENQVSQILHRVCKNINEVSPSEVKGDRSKSVLFDAYRLAKNVREIRNDDAEWETKKMWKFITQVWVEMLAYAASNCKALYHAQHLRHGGELLTHVWLLMAHLGITDKLQISKGFGRAKLIRK
ncbi:hypothetical protein P8452_00180 [Trifolium repens]|nr:hypothetical protein P8452_00180 [Trifolium repens]